MKKPAFLIVALSLAPVTADAQQGTLLVANHKDATVTLIDLTSLAVVATLPTAAAPSDIVVSANGLWAAISNLGDSRPGQSLTLVDIAGRRIERQVDLDTYTRPFGLAGFSDNRSILAVAMDQGALLSINVHRGRVKEIARTWQKQTVRVATAANSERAFVTNLGSGTVSAIHLGKGAKMADLKVGREPDGIAVSPDGRNVWVATRGDDRIAVLNSVSLDRIATMRTGRMPRQIAFTPDGRHALVANSGSDDLWIYFVPDLKPTLKVSFKADNNRRANPVDVAVHPDGGYAVVANAGLDQVSIIDTQSWKTRYQISTGQHPTSVAFSPVRAAPDQP